jgi:hypothetical protein
MIDDDDVLLKRARPSNYTFTNVEAYRTFKIAPRNAMPFGTIGTRISEFLQDDVARHCQRMVGKNLGRARSLVLGLVLVWSCRRDS